VKGEPSDVLNQPQSCSNPSRCWFRLDASVSLVELQTPARDEQQAPEQELDGPLLAHSNQQPCVSGQAPTA
jgi:hypothetical protein